MSGNNFTNNSATQLDKSWKHTHGGAILYSCQTKQCEVALLENRFESNIADHKGGAVRWLHLNFTSDLRGVDIGRRDLGDSYEETQAT